MRNLHRFPWSASPARARPLAVVALLALLLAAAPGTGAAEAGKTITLGESLDDRQEQELLDYFARQPGDRIVTVTTQDTVEAMEGIFDMGGITTAFSSTALTCRDLGDGLDVTTKNITLVTPGLYAMALVTAGIGDATLVVAAPDGLSGVQGMTALAGVFKTWDLAPCASGYTTTVRQRLALEELTLTAAIGQALAGGGVQNGVQLATELVLGTQQRIVTEGLDTEQAIAEAVAGQERDLGVRVPAEQRDRLVDLLERLAEEDIDWSTFAAGWNIEYPDANRITMRGEGIAIRNAQASATAEAAAAMTATAQAAANMTATAQAAADSTATAQAAAALTATAQAQQTAVAQATADALATRQAIAALTATAAAIPTATPAPTATPVPVGVRGTLADVEEARVLLEAESDRGPRAYAVDPGAVITRDGEPVALGELARGDAATLTVHGSTGQVLRLAATAPPGSLVDRLAGFWWVGALGVLLPAITWRRVARNAEPFVIKQVA